MRLPRLPAGQDSRGNSVQDEMAELTRSTVGRKIFMALTGWMMILFVAVHLLGNTTVYSGWINAYAERLHALPPLLWAYRLFMSVVVTVHIFFGIQLTLENRRAKPAPYFVKKHLRATFAGRTMIWSGTVIGGFLLFHLVHFTLQLIFPEHAANRNMDSAGRPDVLGMVIYSFQHLAVSCIYGIAVAALFLHLFHGVESSFQSFGLQSDRTQRFIVRAGAVAATVVASGYLSIPIAALLGILK
ncbi:MAG: succinate dehydrogenase cytochrome b subunit [Nitrospirae bacterium]|nr:succinate dehydrogenase cytochrome b subunit [Nitrospirota bacterium]